MKYNLVIFGCQFNKADAEQAAAILEKIGYRRAKPDESADLVLVLACSVRQPAIDRIFGLKQKWRDNRPKITILSGCILKSDQNKFLEFFDYVLPNEELKKLPGLLKKYYKEKKIEIEKIKPRYQSKFSACVPIMAGCNNFCSYCVVPYTRGREVSRPAEEILAECRDVIKRGYKEIILIGQNVNSYQGKFQILNAKIPLTPTLSRQGRGGVGGYFPSPYVIPAKAGIQSIDFPQLLKTIDKIPGNYWLRFMTSHPKDLSDDLIKTMADGKHITPYLHLPIQAGDDLILKKMNRRYTVKYYKNLIKKVRQKIPGISISTDVIVGFPGETKKQFENTKKVFSEIGFDMAYIAQYSPRAGTEAAKLKDNVSKIEKKRRFEELTAVLEKTALVSNKKLIGKRVKVLVDGFKNGFCFGKTVGFKTVKFLGNKNLIGRFVNIKIKKANPFGLAGVK